jgi:hypothetical protein
MNASLDHRGAGNGMSVTEATGWLCDHSSRIMTAGIILASRLARTPTALR